ncbi:MAG: type II toxin-antitoxin system VapC family toxin [Moorellales bacterium]
MRAAEPRPRGFLLDTTALIDFLRGKKEVAALLEVLMEKAPLATCPVTVAEVFAGTREKDASKADQFLSTLVYYPITYSAARLAGSLRYAYARKGITLSLPDTLIAAVALENGLAVVTANAGHFPMEQLIVIPH